MHLYFEGFFVQFDNFTHLYPILPLLRFISPCFLHRFSRGNNSCNIQVNTLYYIQLFLYIYIVYMYYIYFSLCCMPYESKIIQYSTVLSLLRINKIKMFFLIYIKYIDLLCIVLHTILSVHWYRLHTPRHLIWTLG